MKLKEVFARYQRRLAERRGDLSRSPHGEQRAGTPPTGPAIRPGAGPAGTPGVTDHGRILRPQPTSNPYPGVNVT